MLEVRRMFVAGGRVRKKACMDGNLSNTGLYKHFMTGCPEYQTNGEVQMHRMPETEGIGG